MVSVYDMVCVKKVQTKILDVFTQIILSRMVCNYFHEIVIQ